MDLSHSIIIFVAMFITIMIMDFLWLGVITKNFIISEFGSMVTTTPEGNVQVKLGMGFIAWSAIALLCLIFVVMPGTSLPQVALYGAVMGFLMYVMFDFTNLTFFMNYPLKFALVDLVWGTVLCCSISVVGFFVKGALGA